MAFLGANADLALTGGIRCSIFGIFLIKFYDEHDAKNSA
jgi:hypothetical protein